MKEMQCKNCGVIFEVEGDLPSIECTCKSKEFASIK